jgi:hypothetical protein
MLKKITTEQVCLGMYIHGLEGSWLSHPFWKSKFVLDDPTDLRALKKKVASRRCGSTATRAGMWQD